MKKLLATLLVASLTFGNLPVAFAQEPAPQDGAPADTAPTEPAPGELAGLNAWCQEPENRAECVRILAALKADLQILAAQPPQPELAPGLGGYVPVACQGISDPAECQRRLAAGPTAARPVVVAKPAGRSWGPRVFAIGAVTTLVGALMGIPDGETFDVFGDEFCVTNEYRTYTDGACSTSDSQKMVAATVMLVGIAIMDVGAIKIMIDRRRARKGVTASATVTW